MEVAGIWVDGDRAWVRVAPDGAGDDHVAHVGGRFDPARHAWVLPVDGLEPLCSALDRAGIHWAVDWQSAPRTWAERMCSELPEAVLVGVRDTLRAALRDADAFDHLHLFEHALSDRLGTSAGVAMAVVGTNDEAGTTLLREMAARAVGLPAGTAEVHFHSLRGGVLHATLTGIDIDSQLTRWRRILGTPARFVVAYGQPLYQVAWHTPRSSVLYRIDAETGCVDDAPETIPTVLSDKPSPD